MWLQLPVDLVILQVISIEMPPICPRFNIICSQNTSRLAQNRVHSGLITYKIRERKAPRSQID